MNKIIKYCIISVVSIMCSTCKEDVPLNGARLSPTTLTLLEGSAPQQLYLYLYPSYTTQPEVRWVSDAPAIADVDEDGMVAPLSPGKTRIRVFSGEKFLASSNIVVTPFIHVTKITLNRESLECILGETGHRLSAIIEPEDASNPVVTWSSSNPEIVTVDAVGGLTLHKDGKVTITATAVDGGLTASCVVTVIHEWVTGVSLLPENITIHIGDEEQLVAEVEPENASNKAVTWSSSNTTIVEVDDNGKITGVSTGTATVTVTTDELGFSKSCVVTVERRLVEDLTVSPSEIKLYLAEGSKRLIATVMPTNATSTTVTWVSSNTGVVIVSNTGVLTPRSVGAATITASVEDGLSATVNVTVSDAIRTKGPNLLQNPGFEEPDDNSDTFDETYWKQVPTDWFTAWYGADAGLAPSAANRAQLANFYTSGNGQTMRDICTEKYTARFAMNNANGIYQIVDVEQGADYYISIDIGIILWNTATMSTRGIDAVKVLSTDGMTPYYLLPISPSFSTADRPVAMLKGLSGTFTVPEGVTKVRFQVDKRRFASPDEGPLMGIDECEFRKMTEE